MGVTPADISGLDPRIIEAITSWKECGCPEIVSPKSVLPPRDFAEEARWDKLREDFEKSKRQLAHIQSVQREVEHIQKIKNNWVSWCNNENFK
jgi:hypothetical protein